MARSGTRGLVIMSTVISLVVVGIGWGVYTGTPGYQLPAEVERNPTWKNYHAYAEYLESEESYRELASLLVEAEKELAHFRPVNYIERLENKKGDAFTQHLPPEYKAYFALQSGDASEYDALVSKLLLEQRFSLLDDVYSYGHTLGKQDAAKHLLSQLVNHPDSVQLHPADLLSIGAKELVKIYKPSPTIEEAREINRFVSSWEKAIKGYSGLRDGYYCEDDGKGRPDRSEKMVIVRYYDEAHARIHKLTGKPDHVLDLQAPKSYEKKKVYGGQRKGEIRTIWFVERDLTSRSYYYKYSSDNYESSYKPGHIQTDEYSEDAFYVIDYGPDGSEADITLFGTIFSDCQTVSSFMAEFQLELMKEEERVFTDAL